MPPFLKSKVEMCWKSSKKFQGKFGDFSFKNKQNISFFKIIFAIFFCMYIF